MGRLPTFSTVKVLSSANYCNFAFFFAAVFFFFFEAKTELALLVVVGCRALPLMTLAFCSLLEIVVFDYFYY